MNAFKLSTLVALMVTISACGIFEDFDFDELESEEDARNAADLPTVRPVPEMGPSVDASDMGSMTDSSDSPDACADCPAQIEVFPQMVTLAVGESTAIDARVDNAQGQQISGAEIEWNTEDPAVATVSSSVIEAVSLGQTRVSATSGELTAWVDVTVEDPDVSVDISPKGPLTIRVGQTESLSATVSGDNSCTLEWSVADTSMASVNGSGEVRGLSAGETTVEARCGDASAEVEIEVIEFDTALMGSERLLAWFRATDGITTTGNNVVQWQGISSHMRELETSIQDPPVLETNVLNGLPAVRFSNSETLATVGSYSTREEIIVDRFTIFMVARNANPSRQGQLLSTCTDVGSNQQIRYNGADDSLFVYGHFTDHSTSLTLNSPTTDYQVLTLRRSSSLLDIFQNGQPSASSSTNGSGNFHFSQIGARCTNEYLDGDIAEFLIFGEDLSAAEKSQVEGYLMTRYNL